MEQKRVRLKASAMITSSGKIPASAIKFKESNMESEKIMSLQSEVLSLQSKLQSNEDISQKKYE